MQKRIRQPLPPARAMALQALSDVFGGGRKGGKTSVGTDVQQALDAAIRERSGQHAASADDAARTRHAKDVALATELVYGYLRRKGRIDFILRNQLKDATKLPQTFLRLLGVGVFELMCMDSIPAYASVDWVVTRAGKKFSPVLGKVANGVLRNIDRNRDDFVDEEYYEENTQDRVTFLSAWHGCPLWLVRMWIAAYGEERAEQYLTASTNAPLVGFRINRTRPEAASLQARLHADPACAARTEWGAAFAPGQAPNLSEELSSGLISRQSLASQQALEALEPESWQGPIWDACCGRGGKAAHMLERGMDVTLASDPHTGRLQGLKQELERLGLPEIPVMEHAADQPMPAETLTGLGLKPEFGTILLDAPCSGLGVLSRRPDALWRRMPKDIEPLVRLQAELLARAHEALAPGGRVAYVTCTLNPDENEKQVAAFLAATPSASLIREWATPPDAGLGEFFYGALLSRKP